MQNIIHVLILGCVYAAFGAWSKNTAPGRRLVKYLQNWKADGWVHGILCAVSVYILAVCAILAVGLSFMWLGIG